MMQWLAIGYLLGSAQKSEPRGMDYLAQILSPTAIAVIMGIQLLVVVLGMLWVSRTGKV